MAELLAPKATCRPALLLDLDGVVQLHDSENVPEGYRPNPAYPSTFHNQRHASWLRETSKLADICYISDWQHLSHMIYGQQHDLPEFDWVNTDKVENRHLAKTYSQLRALAITALFGDRPIVWVDDDIRQAEFKWAALRDQNEAPTLLVKPDKSIGLQLQEMEQISTWLQQDVIIQQR